MFHLSKIKQILRLQPQSLNLPLIDAIKIELEALFLDKVVANLGLCISIYDILSIDGGFIFPGDGCPTYEVIMRLVMFQPFVGEIISGKIEESSKDGLRLSLGFFNDIHVPAAQLEQKYKRIQAKGLEAILFRSAPATLPPFIDYGGDDDIWVWDYESQYLHLDLNEEVTFKVISVKYPPIPAQQDANSKPFAPMIIEADVTEDGLGVVSWWQD